MSGDDASEHPRLRRSSVDDAVETEWLKTSDVAQRLGYSTAWVRQQIARGSLPAKVHLTGKRPSFRIRREDFERFVQATFRDS